MTQAYQLYIDGHWRDAENGASMPAINPYDQTVHATVPVASAEDVAELESYGDVQQTGEKKYAV